MKISLVALASLVVLGVTGCGGAGNGVLNIPNPRLTFVNAFDSVANANFQVGTDTTTSPVAYNSASAPVITINGTKDISAGIATFSDLATLPSQLLEQSKRYTVVGYGVSGSRTLALFENDKSNSAPSTVSVRLINGAPALANVDVYLTDAAAGNGLPGGPAIGNLAAGSASNYVALPDGGAAFSLRVRVFVTGTNTNPLADTTYALANRDRISIVVDELSGSTAGLVKLTDSL